MRALAPLAAAIAAAAMTACSSPASPPPAPKPAAQPQQAAKPAAARGAQPAQPAGPGAQPAAAAKPGAATPAAGAANATAKPGAPATPAPGAPATPAPAAPASAPTAALAAPAAPATPAKPATPAPSMPSVAAQPDSTFVYQREGRRDPFLSLVGTGTEPRPTSRRGDGAAGMTVAEISVSGIVQSRGELVAMVHGPDNRTYLVHQGDKFADGTIKQITPQGLVIVQEVNDPLSLIKQREIRKLLRSLEDGKE
ncbi:MAG TPA: hypothetical protein VFA27_15480 [Vicinamibacterales bacterium]|nr:hypothetical protein [Vicinamibacterales bacterium]